jgi:hypothetical protein
MNSPSVPVRSSTSTTTRTSIRRWLWAVRSSLAAAASNQNPRYVRYSNAVSALLWIIDDLAHQQAAER